MGMEGGGLIDRLVGNDGMIEIVRIHPWLRLLELVPVAC